MRVRAEVPKGPRLDLPDPCHGIESLEVVCTVHHGNSIEWDADLVQLSVGQRRGGLLHPFGVCDTIEGLVAHTTGTTGLWRSWERVCMACRRSGVRIPSGPPFSSHDPSGVSQQERNVALAFHPLRAEGHFFCLLWV